MMGCDGACAAGFDLVFIGLPLLSLYEIPIRHGDSCNCGGRSGAPLAVGLVCPSAVGLVCVD